MGWQTSPPGQWQIRSGTSWVYSNRGPAWQIVVVTSGAARVWPMAAGPLPKPPCSGRLHPQTPVGRHASPARICLSPAWARRAPVRRALSSIGEISARASDFRASLSLALRQEIAAPSPLPETGTLRHEPGTRARSSDEVKSRARSLSASSASWRIFRAIFDHSTTPALPTSDAARCSFAAARCALSGNSPPAHATTHAGNAGAGKNFPLALRRACDDGIRRTGLRAGAHSAQRRSARSPGRSLDQDADRHRVQKPILDLAGASPLLASQDAGKASRLDLVEHRRARRSHHAHQPARVRRHSRAH